MLVEAAVVGPGGGGGTGTRVVVGRVAGGGGGGGRGGDGGAGIGTSNPDTLPDAPLLKVRSVIPSAPVIVSSVSVTGGSTENLKAPVESVVARLIELPLGSTSSSAVLGNVDSVVSSNLLSF